MSIRLVRIAQVFYSKCRVRFSKINFDQKPVIRPALMSSGLSEEEQFSAKLRSAQNFMRKIEAELKELVRDYHRMKNRRKRKIAQQVGQLLAKNLTDLVESSWRAFNW